LLGIRQGCAAGTDRLGGACQLEPQRPSFLTGPGDFRAQFEDYLVELRYLARQAIELFFDGLRREIRKGTGPDAKDQREGYALDCVGTP
jgi:hypothetical protein